MLPSLNLSPKERTVFMAPREGEKGSGRKGVRLLFQKSSLTPFLP